MSTLYNVAFHLWFEKLELVCGGLWQVNKGNKPTLSFFSRKAVSLLQNL